jgi:hypothetical protein
MNDKVVLLTSGLMAICLLIGYVIGRMVKVGGRE